VILPAFEVAFLPEPFATPAALRISPEAGGVLITKS
jgi:hypothetical protein